MKKILFSSAAILALAACGAEQGAEETQQALEVLSLDESGEGRVEFDASNLDGGDAVFENVVIRTSELMDEDMMSEDGESDIEFDTEEKFDIGAETLTLKNLTAVEGGTASFDALEMKGVKLIPIYEDETAEITAGSLVLTNPSPELSGWIAGMLGAGEVSDTPPAESISFDDFVLKDIAIVDMKEDEARLGITSISVSDYGALKAGKFAIDGVGLSFLDEESDATGTFKLDNIRIDGVKMDFLKALEAEDEDEAAAQVMQAVYANPIDPGFDSFEMNALNFDLAGVSFALPSLEYKVKRNGDGVPTRITLPEYTATLTADPENGMYGQQLAPMLAAFGFETVTLKGAGVTEYDPETDISTSEESYIEIEDAFRLDTVGTLGGMKAFGEMMQQMDSEAFSEGDQDPQDLTMDALGVLEIHEWTFKLEDEGIVDNAFALFAAQQGMEPAALKTQVVGLVSALPMMAQSSGVDPEIATDLSTAIASFLTNSGTLTISVAPEEPVTFPELMSEDGQVSKARLGFTAQNEPDEIEAVE